MQTTDQAPSQQGETKYHQEAAQLMARNPKLSRTEAMHRVVRKYGDAARKAFTIASVSASEL
jgi:hypothetical protein